MSPLERGRDRAPGWWGRTIANEAKVLRGSRRRLRELVEDYDGTGRKKDVPAEVAEGITRELAKLYQLPDWEGSQVDKEK